MNLSNQIKTTRLLNAVAAGTTDQNGTGVDMQGFLGVRFTFLFGTITSGAVTSCKAQQSSDDGSADTYADLEGTAIAVADDDDNQVVVLEVYRPRERYVRPVIDRGTQNAVIDGIIAEQYGAIVQPTTDDATTVVDSEIHVSPAEGTA